MAKSPKSNGADAPGLKHNGPPTDAQIVEHRKEQLAALTAKHRDADNRIEVQQAKVDQKMALVTEERRKLGEIQSERAQVRTAIQHLAPGGYPMDEFDRSYTDMRLKTSIIDIEQRERYRVEIRDVHGQPSFQQMELDLKQPRPEGATVLVTWRTRGYQDGIQGLAADTTAAGVPPEAGPEYLAGWGDGQAVLGRGLKLLETPKPQPPAGEWNGAPDWSTWDDDNTKWTDEQRERFADAYEQVPLDVTPIIRHPGAKAEFDRLAKLEEAVDEFEAPAAEVKKQAGRKQKDDTDPAAAS